MSRGTQLSNSKSNRKQQLSSDSNIMVSIGKTNARQLNYAADKMIRVNDDHESSAQKENNAPNKNKKTEVCSIVGSKKPLSSKKAGFSMSPAAKGASSGKDKNITRCGLAMNLFSKENNIDKDKKINVGFASKVSYLEDETNRLLAELQKSFNKSAALVRSAKEETPCLSIENEDLSQLLNEMVSILSPQSKSDPEENKWDEFEAIPGSARKPFPLVHSICSNDHLEEKIAPLEEPAAKLHSPKEEDTNCLKMENEKLRQEILNKADALISMSAYCDDAKASIVSMAELLREKDDALDDFENFLQMNDNANKKLIAAMKEKHSCQIKSLEDKLANSSERIDKMEVQLKLNDMYLYECEAQSDAKGKELKEISQLLATAKELFQGESKSKCDSTQQSIVCMEPTGQSQVILYIRELVEMVHMYKSETLTTDGSIAILKEDLQKSQSRVDEEKIMIKELVEKNAQLQDCLASQTNLTNSLTIMNHDALQSISSLTELIGEKENALEEMANFVDMNNQANEKILTHMTEKYKLQLHENEACIQNLFNIIQRQNFGESEYFRKLLREKEVLQMELTAMKLKMVGHHHRRQLFSQFDLIALATTVILTFLCMLWQRECLSFSIKYFP